MGHTVNVHEARSQLSKLMALAWQGESVTVAIHGTLLIGQAIGET